MGQLVVTWRGEEHPAVLSPPTEMQISCFFADKAVTQPPLHPVRKESTTLKRGPLPHRGDEFYGFCCCPSFSIVRAQQSEIFILGSSAEMKMKEKTELGQSKLIITPSFAFHCITFARNVDAIFLFINFSFPSSEFPK